MAKVLYIGEDNLIFKALKSNMIEKGHELNIISSPIESLGELFKSKYDLILTNLLNDEMDGIQLYATISASNTINSITDFGLMTSGENIGKLFSGDNKPKYIFKKNAELVNNILDILENKSDKEELPVKALYVEDDVFVQKLVKMWLKKFPYIHIDMASSIADIQEFEMNEYDIIVTDNLLGDGSAVDVISKIQSSESLMNTPILIYTGTVEKLSLDKLQELGKVVDILPKPFEMKKFVAKLQMVKKLKNR